MNVTKTTLIAGMMVFLVLLPASRIHSQFDNVAEIFRNNVVHISDGRLGHRCFLPPPGDFRLHWANRMTEKANRERSGAAEKRAELG